MAILTILFVLSAAGVLAQKGKPTAEQLLGVKSAAGREFWIAIPANELDPFPADELEIYIASEEDAEVEIFDALTGNNITRQVVGGEVLTLTNRAAAETNWAWEVREAEVVVHKGIRITSDQQVVVYVLNSKVTSSDGYLAIPCRSWADDYIHCSYYDFNEYRPFAGGFIVVAREDGTQVHIDLRGVGALDAKTSGGRTINTGNAYTVTLDAGDIYMVKGDAKTRALFDLTGSRITSNVPIGVIAFHERTFMPSALINGNGRNHLCEMLPPVRTWGLTYATKEFKREHVNGVGKGDVFRVVASEPNTKWICRYYDLTTKALLGQYGGVLAKDGDFADLANAASPTALTSGYSVWEADKPIFLMQYSCSHVWDGDPILDPFMIYIAPVEQFSTNSIFIAPTANKFEKHRLNLIVWADTTDENYVNNLKSLTIDDQPVWSHPRSDAPTLLFNRMPGGNMHWCTIEFDGAGETHVLKSNEKIRCAGYLYGYGAADAYGWPVGAQYRDLSSMDTAAPEVQVESGCTDFTVLATERRNIPSTPRPKPLRTDQVETGISEVEFDPSFANTNFRIVLVTSQVLGEDPFMQFQFRLEVIDKSKNASARVRVRDFGFTEKNGPSNATYQNFTYTAPSIINWKSELTLGKHRVGTGSEKDVVIQAGSSGPLTVNDLRLSNGTHFKFKMLPTFPLVIPQGTAVTVTLEYDALRDSSLLPEGKDLDSMILTTGCSSITSVVSAFAVAPHIEVSDASFGSVSAGSEHCVPLHITNPGSDELVITAISGFEFTNFSLKAPLNPPLPIRIQPKGSVAVSSICYKSTTQNEETATVTFTSNAAFGDSVSTWTANTLTEVSAGESKFASIVVSPQPAIDVLNVRFAQGSEQPQTVALVNARGVEVGTWKPETTNRSMMSIAIVAFGSGSYTLLISFTDRTETVPVMIAR